MALQYEKHCSDKVLLSAFDVVCGPRYIDSLAERVHLLANVKFLVFSERFGDEWDLSAFNDMPEGSLGSLKELYIRHYDGMWPHVLEPWICHLPQLEMLRLEHNGMRDITALSEADLPNLITLYLPRLVRDISPLVGANLPRLEYLSLTSSPFSDLDGFSHVSLPCLTHLDLSHTKVTDISPLTSAHIPNLIHLNLSSTKVSDMHPLSSAPFSLETLEIHHTMVTVDGLAAANLTSLRTLDMGGLNFNDVCGLDQAVPYLEILSLSGSHFLRTLPAAILTMPTLQSLTVDGASIGQIPE